MKILPALEEVRRIAAAREYDVLPVSCEILSDFTTPIETMRILKNVSSHCYMLESAQADETWGRYTFMGFDPKMEITCIGGTMNGVLDAGKLKYVTGDPAEYIRKVLSEYKSPRFDYLPSFTGGLVGYFAYDMARYFDVTTERLFGIATGRKLDVSPLSEDKADMIRNLVGDLVQNT